MMTDRKSQIMLDLDDYRMLKMLSIERGESVEKIIHALLQIIYEQVDYAYETGEVSADMEGFSLTIFKALHLKKLGAFTEQEFKAVIENENLHILIDKVFEADGLKERRNIMDANKQMIPSI
jgi:hypothetical protein